MIPEHYHTQSRVFHKIYQASKTFPNDMELGKLVRSMIQKYKDGKYNPLSTINIDKRPFTDDYIQ
jgi:hypothetical protein